MLGKYGEHIRDEEHNRKVWLHETNTSIALHYTIDKHYKWEGWVVSLERNGTFGKISNRGAKLCPVGLTDGWEFSQPWGWQNDTTLRVSCDQDQTSGAAFGHFVSLFPALLFLTANYFLY